MFVADCLPIAIAGPDGVAMLHGGWRGLAAGIVGDGAERVGGTAAAIGPGIGPCCYEVGEEVLAAFAPLGDEVADGRMLDLKAVARILLRAGGRRDGRGRGHLHPLRARDVLLPSRRRAADRTAGRDRLEDRLMVEPFRNIDPARVAANVAEVRAEMPPGAELLVACKYVPCEEMGGAGGGRAWSSSARTASPISRRSMSAGASGSNGTSSATSRAARSRTSCRSSA